MPHISPGRPDYEVLGLVGAWADKTRLLVLDDGATPRGLLCFNQSSASFCVR